MTPAIPVTRAGGSFQVTMPLGERREGPRALAVPERRDRRIAGGSASQRARSGPAPVPRAGTRCRCEKPTAPSTAAAPVHEAGQQLARPVLERGGALLRRDPGEELCRGLQSRAGAGRPPTTEARQAQAATRAQALGLARRRDQLRRRRLPRRDRRLQRVAAGEHRGDGERRGRAALRVLLEAGEDRPLDRGVEVGHDRGGLDRPLVAVLARRARRGPCPRRRACR